MISTFLSIDGILRHGRKQLFLLGIVALAMLSLFWVIFAYVPDERVMGPVQRIFYFHVGAAMTAYLMVGCLFISSVMYLIRQEAHWDLLGESSGRIALLFCSIVLASGMIWGKAAWNTWWRWEPRLVSFLVLWLLLCSYTLLRKSFSRESALETFSAVLGILCALNVPIVVFSIRILTASEQLHPEVVANQGLRDPRFVVGMIAGNVVVMLFGILLLWFDSWTTVIKRESERLRDL